VSPPTCKSRLVSLRETFLRTQAAFFRLMYLCLPKLVLYAPRAFFCADEFQYRFFCNGRQSSNGQEHTLQGTLQNFPLPADFLGTLKVPFRFKPLRSWDTSCSPAFGPLPPFPAVMDTLPPLTGERSLVRPLPAARSRHPS